MKTYTENEVKLVLINKELANYDEDIEYYKETSQYHTAKSKLYSILTTIPAFAFLICTAANANLGLTLALFGISLAGLTTIIVNKVKAKRNYDLADGCEAMKKSLLEEKLALLIEISKENSPSKPSAEKPKINNAETIKYNKPEQEKE